MITWWEWGTTIALVFATVAVGLGQYFSPNTDPWKFWYGYFLIGVISLIVSLILWSWLPIFATTLMLVIGLCIYGYSNIPFWYWLFFLVAVFATALTFVLYFTKPEDKCGCGKCNVCVVKPKCGCNTKVVETEIVVNEVGNKPVTLVVGDNGHDQGAVLTTAYTKLPNYESKVYKRSSLNNLEPLLIPTDASLKNVGMRV
jgi:hypothetical protein